MSIQRPAIDPRPLVQFDELNHYLARRMRDGSLDFHSAFLLNHEAIRIRRFAYHQSAWNYSLGISGLLAVFMHGLVARALGCSPQLRIVEEWFEQDIPLLRERRSHYFVDRLGTGKALLHDNGFLAELADIRDRYDQLPDSRGPTHVEVFPWDAASPELGLHLPQVPLDSEVESILVDLLTGHWA